jgi:hypothetical protein
MEITQFLKEGTLPSEDAASNPGGEQLNETALQLRRRLIQLISEVSMQLQHACLMDLADYVLAVSACGRAVLAG